ncbi:delta-like protein 1 [Bombyx mandarina]|uniref:Delta-like protein 1 n=1 Tax=Bombyx mandarina TaxID=7092 RepID=A0A6J2JUX3_BOMMA|nr:delta-like protein 1 [Bombyx mandarina]
MRHAILLLICAAPAVLPKRTVKIPLWKRQACEPPAALSEHSHYICNDKGEPKCMPGWQGDLCDVPICRKGCDPIRGFCKKPGECTCKFGYYGDRCEKCIPLLGCVHGRCNEPFQCICNDGWDGLFCTEPTCSTECHKIRGFCESPGECRCRFGWSGPTCHACQTLPGCQHGYCEKPLECRCLPGYTGMLCQTPICAANCHSERGFCRRPGECRCKVGWTGPTCAQCHRYPGCKHGTCRKPWECICKKGWGGMLCDEELNYCEEHPDTCKNGGQCQSLEAQDGHYRCQCPSGVTGKHCDVIPANMTTTEASTVQEFTVEVITDDGSSENTSDKTTTVAEPNIDENETE